ncbi:MAG: response regulator, partial [Mariprofundaceae bacterium]
EEHPYFKVEPYAHLSVEDNGYGIPEDQMIHLFEPFFTTKEVGKGTGLGLAMVFGAIKTHHGYVEVESIEGEGSTFHIYLPLLETDELASVSPQAATVVEGAGEIILLVDDEANVLETSRDVLESLGYQVLVASDGLEAVEVFTEHQDEISLIITDVVMPGLGGVKAVARIRKINPDIKVIFVTGYDKNISLPDAINTSKTAVLSKPYNIEEFSKTIQKQLES